MRAPDGTRRATIETQDPTGGSQLGQVQVSDSIDHTMWGLDLGLRWNATRVFRLELGWRLRDRSVSGGPARFSGPQLKAAYRF